MKQKLSLPECLVFENARFVNSIKQLPHFTYLFKNQRLACLEITAATSTIRTATMEVLLNLPPLNVEG